MIGIFSGPDGGGGGLPPITGIAVTSDSLDIGGTAPNPITAPGGTIDVETTIILDTLAGLQAKAAAGTLVPGCTYGIKPWNKPIGNGKVLIQAHFKAVYDNSAGAITLSPRGHAYSAAHNYDIVYDLNADLIRELYLPALNQRATRTTALRNCIEFLPWENALATDFDVTDTRFLRVPVNPPVITKSKIFSSTIDYNSGNHPIENTEIWNNNLLLVDNGWLQFCTLKPGCNLQIGGQCIRVTFEEDCSNVIQNGSILQNVRIGAGSNFLIDSATTPTINLVYEGLANDIQFIVPVNGGTDQIGNRYNSFIAVQLQPAGVIPAYTLMLPGAPVRRQRIKISSLFTITALTINGGGPAVSGAPATLTGLTQSIEYIWDDATNTYYLI